MKLSIYAVLLLLIVKVQAQEALTYQKPSKEILDLVDVPLAPSVLVDDNKEFMIFLYRDTFKSIEEISQEELRLGGLRINPKTNIGSRVTYYNNLKIKPLLTNESELVQVSGLPSEPKLANFTYSPDQKKMAFTNTTYSGVEVWVVDVIKQAAKKLTEPRVNANLRDVINWFEDGNAILVKMISPDRLELIETKNAVPTGPTISVNDGKKAQNRTYQDLLKNKNDEHNFEQLALSELYKVTLDGKSEKWLEGAMYNNIMFSPDGEYVMVTTVEKPFSYLVPYRRFPSKTVIYSKDGQKVETVLEVPLIEDLPKGFMAVRQGKRRFSWRNDMPASLVYAEALDGGDPEKEALYRDEIFQLNAPFNGESKSLMKTVNRYDSAVWGDEDTALIIDDWWNTRNTKTYLFNPSDSSVEPKIIFDRNYQDRYSDPGDFVTKRNKMGSDVLALKGSYAFLNGAGYSEKGQFPFIDKINLKSLKTSRLYQSEYTDKLENLNNYDVEKSELLVRIESPDEYPNYFIRDLKKNKLVQLTDFDNPFKSIQGIHKEVITYKRDDGLELSGTLYLPVGYNKEKKEKMPMILWAYPREFKDQSSASQKTSNPNKFTFPYYGSPIFWVTKGYVVLDGASFPIVGEGDDQPNDTFRTQLVANAKAAIDAVDVLGYIDRTRVAVGGHSYGAFMVANLLSHSNLFAAGIARSGAYNRTLTPFGFQSEERNYWEAPEVYYTMSPFMHADKMKTPLLMTHGEADNNSGTYPMQSIRYFNALKGLGAQVRLVMLPNESHGYRAKETILHLLWEQDQWLEKYVKNKPPGNAKKTELK
ncbi:prolyl oligopeptidase family serine peptidase [uncultured Eudoraea sp.]|uniref:alpha/beta hydrolase family protein n=1 Tax=uncultured Eudoraea sp. TaxID=1035614 RepID=UPI0026171667|nr:prolyl oligopeptidase family serine peptidase [uncultured Eudoraea sp.]